MSTFKKNKTVKQNRQIKPITAQKSGSRLIADNRISAMGMQLLQAKVISNPVTELQRKRINTISAKKNRTRISLPLQLVGDVDLSYNDDLADDYDPHIDYGSDTGYYPQKGDLNGDTESNYENKLVENTPVYNYYYASQDLGVSDGDEDSSEMIIEKKEEPYQGKFQNSNPKQFKWIATKNFGYKEFKYNKDGKNNIDFYYNNATPKTNPEHTTYRDKDLTEGVTKAGHGQMRSGKIVPIVSASRSRHFSIGDRIINKAPSFRKGKWTWHHQTPEYEMSLVDMNVHRGFGHKGGKSFWT